MAKLARHPFANHKTSYGIGKVYDKIIRLQKKVQDNFVDILKKHALLDEKGEFIPLEDKPGTYQIPDEKQESWKIEADKFNSTVIDLEWEQFKDLEDLKLSAVEVASLEGIIDISF